VNPRDKPSPWVAAGSSFVMFAIGAIVPLIPYLLRETSRLWAGLLFGGVGLLIAGGVAARFTRKSVWWAALRPVGIRPRSRSRHPTPLARWWAQSLAYDTASIPCRRLVSSCRRLRFSPTVARSPLFYPAQVDVATAPRCKAESSEQKAAEVVDAAA